MSAGPDPLSGDPYARLIDPHPVDLLLLDTPTIVVGGELRPVGRPREQAVLARLGLAAPRWVPVDVLIADVWGDEPPPSALDAVRVHVSNLRKLLAGAARPAVELLRTERGGYRLDLPPDAVDVARLEAAVAAGEVATLRAFIDLWPDHDLGRFESGTGFFDAAARRLLELRLAAVEAVVAGDLDAGQAGSAVRLLEQALQHAPYRERCWELLVRALAAAERRVESLRAVRRARAALAEVGIEPGLGIGDAEAAVIAAMSSQSGPEVVARYVDVHGSRVAYATVGTHSVDLLFLHGGFIPLDMMRDAPRLAWFLDELADRFRVLLVDRRGIGMSDGPADSSPVDIEHWVADCLAVLDVVSSRQVIVLGHEHGGPVAIRLAAEAPDRVVGLLLHSTAARPLRGPDHPYGPTEDAFERIDRMIDRLPGSEDMLRVVAPSAGDDVHLRSWLDRAGRLGAGPARARELHRTYMRADVRASLPLVQAPAAVLHPARMIRTDPGQARFLAEHLPDAELHLLDSADHLFWVADPDAAAVLAALDRLRARAPGAEERLQLRAIVAVAPVLPGAAGLLTSAGAGRCASMGDAVVATFDSVTGARAAVDAIARADPTAAVVLELADTTGLPGDAAMVGAAAAARRALRPATG